MPPKKKVAEGDGGGPGPEPKKTGRAPNVNRQEELAIFLAVYQANHKVQVGEANDRDTKAAELYPKYLDYVVGLYGWDGAGSDEDKGTTGLTVSESRVIRAEGGNLVKRFKEIHKHKLSNWYLPAYAMCLVNGKLPSGTSKWGKLSG